VGVVRCRDVVWRPLAGDESRVSKALRLVLGGASAGTLVSCTCSSFRCDLYAHAIHLCEPCQALTRYQCRVVEA
jgi:hypothetical protein